MPGNPHVRFDERGWETGRRFGVSARAHPRLYTSAADGRILPPPQSTSPVTPFINSGLLPSLLSVFTVPDRISIEDIEARGSQLQ